MAILAKQEAMIGRIGVNVCQNVLRLYHFGNKGFKEQEQTNKSGVQLKISKYFTFFISLHADPHDHTLQFHELIHTAIYHLRTWERSRNF